MEKKEKVIIVVCGVAVIAAGILHFAGANAVLAFVVTAVALALLAMIVGDATEQLGSRLGPGATGILQAGLGNLPELFVAIFALRAGLAELVQAALIGSKDVPTAMNTAATRFAEILGERGELKYPVS